VNLLPSRAAAAAGAALLSACLVFCGSLLATRTAHAQSSSSTQPTQEQLELLKSLPPEQQRAVIDQVIQGGQGGDGRVTDPPLSEPQIAQPKQSATQGAQPATQGVQTQPVPAGQLPAAQGASPGSRPVRQGTGLPIGLGAEYFPVTPPLMPEMPELQPFGYDVFSTVPTTFAPATDIPVPAEYVLGPGDTLEVQLVGERGGRYTLTVGRDGTVDFPNLGPIAVAGQRFPAAKQLLEQRVAEQMIGMRANVAMGSLRSIRIFVLGEAERPGSYTVSGLSTITNALFASGGVKTTGSLRNIQLKRSGAVVTRLDLYDLLLEGNTRGDVRLLPGDVIFIPPVGITVGITGEVRRPALYEVKEGARASDVLYLTGGLTPRADPRTARLTRIEDRRNRTIVDVDLTTAQGRGRQLQSGDLVTILPIRESLEGAVSLSGNVHRPRFEQFRPGMRLTDLVGNLDELKPLADRSYVLIRRESGVDRRVSVVSADLAAAFATPRSDADLQLQPRDQVFVFDLAQSRETVVAPIMAELQRQSGHDDQLRTVGVGGRIKVPGQYPLEPGMTVRDLLRAGGGLDAAAFGSKAELTRYAVASGEYRQTEVVTIDLGGLMAGDMSANVVLQPHDYLLIKEMPEWRDREEITLNGEVRFPGVYPIRRGETLRSVIERAGGLTDQAFVEGSVFTRLDLKEREVKQLQDLSQRLQRELAALSLQQSQATEKDAAQAIAAGKGLLADLESTQAVGRLVIDLASVLSAAPGSEDDLSLKGGDELTVPRKTQEVTVLGEVQGPTSHLYQAGLGWGDYVGRSGGYTQRADKDRTYVIRANGEVVTADSSGWLGRSTARAIHAGDTVVVPLNAQKMRPLTMWTSVTQILYNIAVAVAAVNSF
jgi:Periplasmic protein involved in polysaccharide export